MDRMSASLRKVFIPKGWNFIMISSILAAATPLGKVSDIFLPYMGVPIPFFNLNTFSFLSGPDVGIMTFVLNAFSLYFFITVTISIIKKRVGSNNRIFKAAPKIQDRYYYLLMLIGFAGLCLVLWFSYLKSVNALDISDSIIFLIFITPTIISALSTLHGYMKSRK